MPPLLRLYKLAAFVARDTARLRLSPGAMEASEGAYCLSFTDYRRGRSSVRVREICAGHRSSDSCNDGLLTQASASIFAKAQSRLAWAEQLPPFQG